jgi:hypothetical protein
MFEKDYVMRMIKEFGRVLAKIVLLRETENYIDAKTELNGLSKLVTGFEIEQLLALGSEGIKYVFSKNKDSEAEKIYCAAKIIKEEAMLLEAENKHEDSLKCFSLAKELFKMASGMDFPEQEDAAKEFKEIK